MKMWKLIFPGKQRQNTNEHREKRDQLIEELMPFEDHLERFTYIIDRAKSIDPLPEDCKIETFLIKGCVSQLWVFPSLKMVAVWFMLTLTPQSLQELQVCFANFTVMKPQRILFAWNPISSLM